MLDQMYIKRIKMLLAPLNVCSVHQRWSRSRSAGVESCRSLHFYAGAGAGVQDLCSTMSRSQIWRQR